jgi:biopolymer transport protein ExbD
MSASIEPQGKGGKRSLTAELNLVPLITAVWTQLAQLNVKQYGSAPSDVVEPPMTKIAVVVGPDELNVMVNQEREVLPNKKGQADLGGLAVVLKKAKSQHPDKDDIQIASTDSILFDRLTGVMDVTIAAGFPGVSLVPSNEAGL